MGFSPGAPALRAAPSIVALLVPCIQHLAVCAARPRFPRCACFGMHHAAVCGGESHACRQKICVLPLAAAPAAHRIAQQQNRHQVSAATHTGANKLPARAKLAAAAFAFGLLFRSIGRACFSGSRSNRLPRRNYRAFGGGGTGRARHICDFETLPLEPSNVCALKQFALRTLRRLRLQSWAKPRSRQLRHRCGRREHV